MDRDIVRAAIVMGARVTIKGTGKVHPDGFRWLASVCDDELTLADLLQAQSRGEVVLARMDLGSCFVDHQPAVGGYHWVRNA